MPSRAPAGVRAPDGARAGAAGAGESSVTPSVISAALSSVAASLKFASSVSPPVETGSSPKTVSPVSTSGTVETPHEEQNRALGEIVLPQDEQNMERRFYQRNPRKTTSATETRQPPPGCRNLVFEGAVCKVERLPSNNRASARLNANPAYDIRSTCTAVP